MKFTCAHCGKRRDKHPNAVNRAQRDGLRLFCDRRCSGLGRRKHKPKAQRIAEKRIYDTEYRQKNLARITERKAAYFQRTYDPELARIVRKERMPKHLAY